MATAARSDDAIPHDATETFHERWVECSAGKLFGVEVGQAGAPAILLVHGYPDSHHVWRPVMQVLARSHHVFAYDVRGAGASCQPTTVDDYGMYQLADDIEAVATEVFGGQAFHLVGHDWGGIQSWEAVSRRDLAANIESFMSFSGPSLDHVALWMREGVQGRASQRFAVLRQMLSSMYIPALLTPGLPAFLWRFALANRWRREHAGSSFERFLTLETDGAIGANLYRANVVRALRRPRTVTSEVPTRLVGLTRDPYVSADLMRASINHLTNASYLELDEDHWSVFDDPESLGRVISQWVAQNVATRSSVSNL